MQTGPQKRIDRDPQPGYRCGNLFFAQQIFEVKSDLQHQSPRDPILRQDVDPCRDLALQVASMLKQEQIHIVALRVQRLQKGDECLLRPSDPQGREDEQQFLFFFHDSTLFRISLAGFPATML